MDAGAPGDLGPLQSLPPNFYPTLEAKLSQNEVGLAIFIIIFVSKIHSNKSFQAYIIIKGKLLTTSVLRFEGARAS